MVGYFYDCQEINKHQALAHFINCGASATQLVISQADRALVMRDALDHLQEHNKLYAQSIKKNAYLAHHNEYKYLAAWCVKTNLSN